MDREQWLTLAVEGLLDRVFIPAHQPYDPSTIRVSCGWPSKHATGARIRALGQCWARQVSRDHHNEIFISPILDDGLKVLGVLCHELCHAVDDCKNGHKAAFKRIAIDIGLTSGKPKEVMPGPELDECLNELLADLGPYPHARLDPSANETKKQSTRMVKLECGSCGCVIRTTRKWLDSYQEWACPCGEPLTADQGAEANDE